jgi:hypothetical protein
MNESGVRCLTSRFTKLRSEAREEEEGFVVPDCSVSPHPPTTLWHGPATNAGGLVRPACPRAVQANESQRTRARGPSPGNRAGFRSMALRIASKSAALL